MKFISRIPEHYFGFQIHERQCHLTQNKIVKGWQYVKVTCYLQIQNGLVTIMMENL